MLDDSYRFDSGAVKKALEYDGTFGFVLLSILLSHIDDITQYDIDELIDELEDKYNANIPDENVNKLNAAITLLTTDYIYTNINVLKAVSLTLDDGDMGDIATGGDEPVDVCQVLWAVMEASLINGESFDDNVERFDDNVTDWINDLIAGEGYDADIDDSIDEVTNIPYYGRVIQGKTLLLAAQIRLLAGNNDTLKKELGEAIDEMLADNGVSEQTDIEIQ